MNFYKFIILIIDSDNLPYYEENRKIIKLYHNLNQNIKSLFLRMDNNILEPVIKEDTLFIPGTESYIPGILDKSLLGMKYCIENFSFEFLIRTNISSFWDYKNLLSIYPNLQKNNLIKAVIGDCNGLEFPSGCGFICSTDVIKKCIDNINNFDRNLPDDVSFGKFFIDNNFTFTKGERYDFLESLNLIEDEEIENILKKNHYHYRIMGNYGYNRNYDKNIFQKLYSKIYHPEGCEKTSKTTIVTFFFDLTTFQVSDQSRNLDYYIQNSKDTLSIDNKMIIFCDQNTYELIKEKRDEFQPLNKTVYIIKNMSEYDIFKLNIEIVKENRDKQTGYLDPRNTPYYFLTTMFKIIALKISKDLNPFNSDYYTWIDFGAGHVCKEMNTYVNEILSSPKPKISLSYIHYRSSDEINEMESYLRYGNPCSVASGLITAQKEYIDKFYMKCMNVFYEQISKGVGHSEESVLVYVVDRYPELFNIFYSDYQSIFTNYFYIINDYNTIKNCYILQSLYKGRKDLAEKCVKKVFDSIQEKLLNLNNEEIDLLNYILK